ncbi:hypothetical protein GGX14DRAFT_404507 [Mycena pura]|uniref:Uncharacterized protein n=1 Tax=Mycena pura TaxID=153505 RepID=A0AAD6UTS8_9AGAR|nr:hypothetical protein GGX14DRAFT_404507 [Mycena pura]
MCGGTTWRKEKQGMCRLRKGTWRLGLRALHREQLETWESALYLESSSSFWIPPSRKRIVECHLSTLREQGMKRNNGVPKGKQGMCRGTTLRKSTRAARDLGLRALAREQLELLDSALPEAAQALGLLALPSSCKVTVAEVDGEQLERVELVGFRDLAAGRRRGSWFSLSSLDDISPSLRCLQSVGDSPPSGWGAAKPCQHWIAQRQISKYGCEESCSVGDSPPSEWGTAKPGKTLRPTLRPTLDRLAREGRRPLTDPLAIHRHLSGGQRSRANTGKSSSRLGLHSSSSRLRAPRSISRAARASGLRPRKKDSGVPSTTKNKKRNNGVPKRKQGMCGGTTWRKSSALYLESSSSFWTPPSRKRIVECHLQRSALREQGMKRNNGVPKGKQGMCRGTTLRKSTRAARDLGLRALSREQLELLDSALSEAAQALGLLAPPSSSTVTVAEVDGEQLERVELVGFRDLAAGRRRGSWFSLSRERHRAGFKCRSTGTNERVEPQMHYVLSGTWNVAVDNRAVDNRVIYGGGAAALTESR